jgi:hypothetical protein
LTETGLKEKKMPFYFKIKHKRRLTVELEDNDPNSQREYWKADKTQVDKWTKKILWKYLTKDIFFSWNKEYVTAADWESEHFLFFTSRLFFCSSWGFVFEKRSICESKMLYKL